MLPPPASERERASERRSLEKAFEKERDGVCVCHRRRWRERVREKVSEREKEFGKSVELLLSA